MIKIKKGGIAVVSFHKNHLFLLVSLFLLEQIAADTYYVSKNGSDSNNGSEQSPFQTIQKAAEICNAGDICIIREGMYHETVTPQNSGSSSNPITFKAANNETVIISGADTVTGWAHHDGNIYKAPVSWDLGPGLNQVFIDGHMMYEARYPDVDQQFEYTSSGAIVGLGQWDEGEHFRRTYPPDSTPSVMRPVLAYQLQVLSEDGHAHNDPTGYVRVRITHKSPYIHGRVPDFWKGAMLWAKGSYYAGGGQIVKSEDDGDFTILSIDVDRIKNEAGIAGFYMSGLMHFLTSPKEWIIDSGQLYLYAPGGAHPENMLVTVKKRHLGFDLSNKSYINLENLIFHGTGMIMEKSRNCAIDGCHFFHVSHYTGFEWISNSQRGGRIEEKLSGNRGIMLGGTDNLFTNSSVQWSTGSGILLGDTNNIIDNNVIRYCNYSGTYCAGIFLDAFTDDDVDPSTGHVITRNTINAMGRSVIHTGGASGDYANMTITYNNFYDGVLLNEDGGLIYGAGLCNNTFDIGYNWFRAIYNYNVGYMYLDHGGGSDVHLHHNVFFPNPTEVGTFNPLAMDDDNYYHNNTFVAQTFKYDATFTEHWNNLKTTAWGAQNNIDATEDVGYWQFTDPANGDYTLTANSPAVDAGIEIGTIPTRDSRVYPSPTEGFVGSAPDLGAYEYGKDPWIPGHTWGDPPEISDLFIQNTSVSSVKSGKVKQAQPEIKISNRIISINLSDNKLSKIQIFNSRGQKVFSSNVFRSAILPMPKIASGTYMIKISGKTGVFVEKLLVSNR